MRNLYADKKSCFGCGACAAACRTEAISMELDEEGFPYPHVDASRCVDCGRCQAVCPTKNPLPHRAGDVYAVRCKDTELLESSTSGGAFSLLAQEVLERGGAVCGACFDGDFVVRHVLSRDIAPMRKSKYVQSDMSGCYLAVREALRAGHPVLFSGTPCQCHAMKRFLRGEAQEKLITVSLVCRGVQSPGLWNDYCSWLSRNGALQAYDFRDKRMKNNGHAVSYTINGEETVVPMGNDRLSRMYNRALTFRPSCYWCPYCRVDNDFDFTLGDFWGIERTYPPFADGRGTSLLIARGARGKELLARIAGRAQLISLDAGAALQPALTAPAKEHVLRKFLFRDYLQKDENNVCNIPLILKKYSTVKI